jgi:drug/metabolite transporter (DMT)-like permease
MWTGGAILLVVGTLSGERFDFASYSGKTYLAWGYLVVFGSMVAFSAYVWLLGNAPISLVATYAYVNPVVAVALGALILDEPITTGLILGFPLIIVGSILGTWRSAPPEATGLPPRLAGRTEHRDHEDRPPRAAGTALPTDPGGDAVTARE